MSSNQDSPLTCHKICLIIDPGMISPTQEALSCAHKIAQEFSSHSFFKIVHFAPYLMQMRLSEFLEQEKELFVAMPLGAVLSLGSIANITDNYPFVADLAEDLQTHVLSKDIPFFGICFSHQLFAHMHGFKVCYLKHARASTHCDVPMRKHHVFRSVDILHPKISLLAAKFSEKDYFSNNALDLAFKDVLQTTRNWENKDWQNLQTLPLWQLSAQEYRVKKFIEENTEKNIISHARHEQEVWNLSPASSEVALGASSLSCHIEALVHTKNPSYTFQTHPETAHDSKGGYLILKNFLYLSTFFDTIHP